MVESLSFGAAFRVPEGRSDNSPARSVLGKRYKGIRVPEGRLRLGRSGVPDGTQNLSHAVPPLKVAGYSLVLTGRRDPNLVAAEGRPVSFARDFPLQTAAEIRNFIEREPLPLHFRL